jgi:hypothetical protein
MTLVEALIALVIASGVTIVALEASRRLATRSEAAALETEALLRAEALLGAARIDPTGSIGSTEGRDGPSLHWSTRIERRSYGRGPAQAFEITAQVTITRGDARIQRSLTTLKTLESGPR